MNTSVPDPTQELLTPWLIAYDFVVADENGQPASPIPFELTTQVESIKDCLQLLEQVWPRNGPRPPTCANVAQDVTTPGGDSGRRPDTFIDVPGFKIIGEIARGGMGVVYKARQESLDRIVAIKCLPSVFAQDPHRLARFEREAKAAAKSVHKGILPIYDVLEAGGVPVLVMPYIEGSDLARIVADRVAVLQGRPLDGRHPWASLGDADYLAHVLPLLDKAVEALTMLHRADVIHRDIKPSNILVDKDGHAWLSDFGLARLGTQEGLTLAGQGLGTPGFMSPEQWDGAEAVDGRTDVFSLGVTFYQALTLAIPFGRNRVGVDTDLPRSPSTLQPLLSRALDAVILRALAPDRRDRYQSAAAFQEDWMRARQGLTGWRPRAFGWRARIRRWRGRLAIGGLLLLVVALFALTLLAGHKDRGGADDQRTVSLTTNPVGADVVFVPIDLQTGEPDGKHAVRPEDGQKTPTQLRVSPGTYFVEVALPDGRFHQVYRDVPRPSDKVALASPQHRWNVRPDDGVVVLPAIAIPPATVTCDMAARAGGNFVMGRADLDSVPPHRRFVAAYFLDTTEVTAGQYRKLMKGLPSTFHQKPQGDNYPITRVSFDEATTYAEKAGKRLPTEAEYEFAATNGGTTKYPWGNDPARMAQAPTWTFPPAGQPAYDRTTMKPPIYGLFSNVTEWTSSWMLSYPSDLPWPFSPEQASQIRVVRGGPNCISNGHPDRGQYVRTAPATRQGFFLTDPPQPGLGFRCARSAHPLFLNQRRTDP